LATQLTTGQMSVFHDLTATRAAALIFSQDAAASLPPIASQPSGLTSCFATLSNTIKKHTRNNNGILIEVPAKCQSQQYEDVFQGSEFAKWYCNIN